MQNILLASHGTIGAQAAEQKAIEMCTSGTHVTHLVVIPEFWQHITGDDWLNNSSTRKRFETYIEQQLADEVDINILRVQNQLNRLHVNNTYTVVVGNPEKILLETCKRFKFDCIVMGSKRPKNTNGLNSNMLTKKIRKNLSSFLVIAPHPNA